MKDNNARRLKFLLSVGLCVVMGVLLIGVSYVTLQAAAFEEELVAPVQEIASELPVLPAPEAPVLPYSPEKVMKEQDIRGQEGKRQRELMYNQAQQRMLQENVIVQEEEIKRAQEIGQERRTQAVLCFLDDSEIRRKDKNSAVLQQLIAALVIENEKAIPIIVSGSLLAHLFSFVGGNHTFWMAALVRKFYYQFDSLNWRVKMVDSNLFLLMPVKNFSVDEVIQFSKDDSADSEITDLEYKLGLKVNHMKVIANDDILYKYTIQNYFEGVHAKFFGNAWQGIDESSKQFVHAVLENRLFVPVFYQDEEKSGNKVGENIEGEGKGKEEVKLQSALSLERFSSLPEMVIYITGHGGYDKSIASISIKTDVQFERSEFQRMLDCFATRIKTKLLVVMSCYAAGFNAQKILSELKKGGSTKVYPFNLVVLTTGDAKTAIGKPVIGDNLQPVIYFDKFVHYAKGNLGDLDQIKRTVFSLIPDLKIYNIPQWRSAGSALWVSLSEDDKAVIHISKTMAETRKKPLFIAPYIDKNGNQRDPQVVLLAAENIFFDIIIDSAIKKVPAFVSLVPGKVIHVINKLVYKGEWFNANDFYGDIHYAVPKIFYIDELIVIKDGQLEKYAGFLIEKNKFIEAKYSHNKAWQYFDAFDLLWNVIQNNGDDNDDNFNLIIDVLKQISTEEINKFFDKYPYTLLIHAILSNNFDRVYQILVDKGADIRIKNKNGETGLHLVCWKGIIDQIKQIFRMEKPETISMLIDMQNNDGQTALHNAAETGKIAMVELLLNNGADKRLKNIDGNTAYDIAKGETEEDTQMLKKMLSDE